MNFLNTFEDHVAGIFGAARAPFSFKKLARQAAHEMEGQTLVVGGVDTAPALYTILIANDDDPLMAPYYPQLTREVGEFVKASAEKRGYAFVGEPLVRFMIDRSLKSGKFSVFAENVDAPTLARLYDEERAYQAGSPPRWGSCPRRSRTSSPWPAPAPAQQPAAQPNPFAPQDTRRVRPVRARRARPRSQDGRPRSHRRRHGRRRSRRRRGSRCRRLPAVPAAAPRPQQAAPIAQLRDVVTGEVLPIAAARCTIGRERAAADVVLRDPNVSRRHAELTFTGSDWTIVTSTRPTAPSSTTAASPAAPCAAATCSPSALRPTSSGEDP